MVKKNTPHDVLFRHKASIFSLSWGGGGRPTPKNLDKQNENKNKTTSMYDM